MVKLWISYRKKLEFRWKSLRPTHIEIWNIDPFPYQQWFTSQSWIYDSHFTILQWIFCNFFLNDLQRKTADFFFNDLQQKIGFFYFPKKRKSNQTIMIYSKSSDFFFLEKKNPKKNLSVKVSVYSPIWKKKSSPHDKNRCFGPKITQNFYFGIAILI